MRRAGSCLRDEKRLCACISNSPHRPRSETLLKSWWVIWGMWVIWVGDLGRVGDLGDVGDLGKWVIWGSGLFGGVGDLEKWVIWGSR